LSQNAYQHQGNIRKNDKIDQILLNNNLLSDEKIVQFLSVDFITQNTMCLISNKTIGNSHIISINDRVFDSLRHSHCANNDDHVF